MWLPESASSIAPKVDQLFWIIFWVTAFFFFLVQGALLFFVLKYRAGKNRPASYVHGNTLLEVVWTVIPALILLVLTILSQRLWIEIRSPRHAPKTDLTVEILAEQFAWNVRYPGPDGQLGTADDVSAINQLHLPVDQPVTLRILSKDVIHSFYVPEFRIKQDAVPGLPTQVWVAATRAGHYEIRCAELCGLGHYRMKGFVTTEPVENFQQWLVEAKANE